MSRKDLVPTVAKIYPKMTSVLIVKTAMYLKCPKFPLLLSDVGEVFAGS